MSYTIHGVLAGAYKAKATSMLTHASIDGGRTSLCKRVKEYNLCDATEIEPPTCAVCATKIAWLSR